MTNRYRAPEGDPSAAPRRWFSWPSWAWAAAAITVALLATAAVVAHGDSWIVALLVPFAAVSVALAAVDMRWRVIPNRIVLPATVGALAIAGLTGLADGELLRALWALIGCVGLFVVYLVPALIAPGAMGFGDVKLAALAGAVLGSLGLQAWVAGALAGFVIGAIVGLVGLASRRVTLRSRLPFAPSMLAGVWVAIVLSGFTG